MTLFSKLAKRWRDSMGIRLPSAVVLRKRRLKRKLMVALVGIPLLAISPLAVSQWNIYRGNLAVEDKDWPLAAPIKKSDRLLIVSPHCDDETLGAGGTIAAARKSGASVRVVFVTNGDGSGTTRYIQQARELKAKINPAGWLKRDSKNKSKESDNLFQRIAAMRQRETLAACAKMGLAAKDAIFLGYPDGGTRAMWETNWSIETPFRSPYTGSSSAPYANAFTPKAPYAGVQITRDLEKIFREWKPTVVMTTHPEDTHPDHWAAYAYSSATLEKLRLDAKQGTWATRTRLLGFLVHHGIWPTPNGYHPEKNLLPPASLVKSDTQWQIAQLSRIAQEAKRSALECYASQLATTPRYLRAFVRRNEMFGSLGKSSKTVDPPSDSSWSEAWPPVDIRGLHTQNTPAIFTLQTELAGGPSSRVKYRYAIHVVTAQAITAWQVEVRTGGKALQAILTKAGSTSSKGAISLKATSRTKGFAFELPRQKLGLQAQPATLLISAATISGSTRFDQTATSAFSWKLSFH